MLVERYRGLVANGTKTEFRLNAYGAVFCRNATGNVPGLPRYVSLNHSGMIGDMYEVREMVETYKSDRRTKQRRLPRPGMNNRKLHSLLFREGATYLLSRAALEECYLKEPQAQDQIKTKGSELIPA